MASSRHADSFCDGGRFFDPRAAIDAGWALAPTAPNCSTLAAKALAPIDPVSEAEELRRVLASSPSSRRATRRTRRSTPARQPSLARALAAVPNHHGRHALSGDPAMLPLAVSSPAGVLRNAHARHSANDADAPQYDDVIADISHG